MRSHEFQVIADTGEDAIVYCPTSDYAANIELAEALRADRAARGAARRRWPRRRRRARAPARTWPRCWACRCSDTVKSLVLATDELNDGGRRARAPRSGCCWCAATTSSTRSRPARSTGLNDGFRFATVAEIEEHFGCKPGYLGPIGTRQPVKVVADRTVAAMSDFVCGANEADFHYTGVNWGRDLPEPDLVADIRNVVAGDPSPDGKGVLAIQRGIEVGHVFYLGTKYSAGDERHLPRRDRQAAADGDGLLRHRRHAHPRRGDRAEPR